MNDINKQIGAELREIRRDSGLSRTELAAKLQLLGLDVSEQVIYHLENGHYRMSLLYYLALRQILKFDSKAFEEKFLLTYFQN